MRLTKRLLSAFLAFVMVFTMLPLQAHASEDEVEDKQDSAYFGDVVNASPKARAAEKIEIPVGETTQIDRPWFAGSWKVEQNGEIIQIQTDSDNNLIITGLKPGKATVKYEGKLGITEITYKIVVIESGNKQTFTVNPNVSNAVVAYATNIGGQWSDIQSVSGETLVFNNFATDRNMGYVVFFVKGTSDYLITGLNADGAGNIYPIQGGYGQIAGYPGINEIASKAQAQGYQACFGYSKAKKDLPQSLGFTVAGQRPGMSMKATASKTSDVVPNDNLKFIVTIRPDQELAGRKLTITDLSLTSLKINGTEVSHGELTQRQDGTYVVEVDYTATVEDCLQGKIQLSASASVSYSYSLTADQATVTTSAKVTASATTECAIGARKGVVYSYQYIAPDGVQPPSNIPAAPIDNEIYFSGSTVTVKAFPNSPVNDEVNGGTWTFDGWYLGDVKYNPDQTVTMQGERLNFVGNWNFAYTLHKATFEYQNVPDSIIAPAAKENLHKGEKFTLPAAATRDGYEFDGWKLDEHTYQPDNTFTMPNRDVTFIGSFSVPDSQKYAVRANIYLGNQGKGKLLATEDKVDLTWDELQNYYDMQHYELANEFWNLNLTDNSDLNHTHWITDRKDANRVYNGRNTDEEFHIVNIYLDNDSPALVTLTYDANAGTDKVTDMPDPQSAMYLKGKVVTVVSAPKRENYTFEGWKDSSGTLYLANSEITLTDDTTLYAQWTANTAGYTVQYWFQNADNDDYKHREELDASGNGNIGSVIVPEQLEADKIPTGFEYKSHDADVEISEDGNAVAKVYYDRKNYNISYELDGENQPGVRLPERSTGRYGAQITIEEDLSAEGYTFTGWHTAEDSLVPVADNEATFTMPAGDVTLYGKFSKRTDLAYTVKYLWNDTTTEVADSTTVPGQTFGDTVTVLVPAIVGYTPVSNDAKSITITAGENVVNIYYYKNVTLTANSDNSRIYNGESQSLSGYTASVEGLTFNDVVAPTASGINAGKYDLTFADGTKGKTDSTGKYIVTEVENGTLTINKRQVALESESGEQLYNGKALTKPDVKIGDVEFVKGDVTEVKATGTQTLVGESQNTIKIFWSSDALAKNYAITENLGTLTVTAPENLNDYVVKTHAEQNFKVGDTVTFKITVTNIYAVNATVTLKEEAGMTFENGLTTLEDVLDPGQTKTYTATHTLTDADFKNGVSNTVEVTLTPEGGNPTTGTDTDEVELEEMPNMSVVKTVLNPKESYRVGDTIQYQIIVTNTGNVTLHDLELTDVMNADGKVTFPAGTDLTRKTLNVGGSWTVTCSYVVRAADEGKTISNTAKVISRDDDGNPNKDGEDTTPGESVQKRYSLTIHYRNGAGNAVAGSYSARYHVGDSFKIVSPIVAGYYDPQTRSISPGPNGMPAQDLEYVVIYTAIPVPAPDPGPGPAPNPGPGPGPAPNPGPDDGDDDDDTPPVPNPEQEQPPQPQDFEIDPDDYTLTELEDNETPLANLDLDGHTCCIMHLLLMLAAMVVLGFYTKSRKKHQARIFELKRILAAEEDHPDDPQQP